MREGVSINGRALVELRWLAGMDQVDLANAACVQTSGCKLAPSHISAYEREVKKPTTANLNAMLKALKQALKAKGLELGPTELRALYRTPALDALDVSSPPPSDGPAWDDAVTVPSGTRADFLRFARRVIMFAFVPLPMEALERIEAALTRKVPVDDALVESVEQVTGALRMAYSTTPPTRLARAARRHVEDVGQLVELLEEPMLPRQRHRLTAAAGDAAILVGWLARDVDRRVDARAFFDLATSLAVETRNATLYARSLRCSSALVSSVHHGRRAGDPRRALALAKRANAALPGSAPAHTRLQLTARQAIEHAADNQADDCARLLNRTQVALADARAQDQAGRFGLLGGLDWVKGLCALLLGDADAAEPALTRALAEAPTIRERAVVLADLGGTCVLQDRPEVACQWLGVAAMLASEGGYTLGLRRVEVVRAGFGQRWDGLECVADLDEQLRALVGP